MKRQLTLLTILLIALSCDTNSDLTPDTNNMQGFWMIEKINFNGNNAAEIVGGDLFQSGSSHLNLTDKNVFYKPYDGGEWRLSGRTLILDRDESFGQIDWEYKIIEFSKNKLVLEIELTEGEYHFGSDAFTDNEVIVIREFYTREN